MTDSGSNWDHQTVDNKAFLELKKHIAKTDLEALSENLGIEDGTLAAIKADNEGHHAEIVHNLLRKWRQMKGGRATNRVLYQALDAADRADLARAFRKGEYSYKRGNEDSSKDSTVENETPTAAAAATTTDNVPYYKMSSKPLGKCLILTYSFEGKGEMERRGNSVDERNLKKVFGKEFLNFDVEHHPDLNFKRTMEVMEEMSKKDHGDCFVLFVCSHGDQEGFFTSDMKKITIQEVLTQFNVKNCASLAGKPKIFFFNTCRGEAFHEMVEFKLKTDSGSASSGIGATISYYRPNEADFCLILSTVPCYRSFRDDVTGSFFVENVCKCLEERYTTLHLIDLLTVNNDIMISKAEKDERCKIGESIICQVSTIITSMSKALYFVDKDK